MKIISKRLRELREEISLSQNKIAKKIGINQTSVFRYENDVADPSAKTLLWYADYFDVSLDYIFGRTDNPQGKLFEHKPKAIETGKAATIISSQIEKRQLEKQNLEAQIAREKILKPKLEFEQVKFFFQKFIKGDISDIKFRQALVDTFINKVYLFQDKIYICCNAGNSKIEIPLHETVCSYKGHLVDA